ncbi:NTF2-related export protein 2 isoform X1 [Procambarus clarkii]|uniref:NTF2-related export protein 2 isoform X1 n=2 Tax=Procambarus clarkii TaxID=6728 RepID=UPI0037446FF9
MNLPAASRSLVNKPHEMAAETDRMKILAACTAAENFTKLYYEFVDKMRHKLSKLYLEDGKLVWNGTAVDGNVNIQKFYEDLPTSFHIITCLDSQPVREEAVGEQSTIQVTTSGFVTFKEHKHLFNQSFLITAKEDKWKVVSDVFRFQQ